MISEEHIPSVAPFEKSEDGIAFARYAAIIRRLRAPDGCPWDRKQTLNSLRRFLVEENFELVSAINDNDIEHVTEEVGDLLLVLMLVIAVLEEQHEVAVTEILSGNADKLIRRHPHVFGDVQVNSTDDVVDNWNRIKAETEGRSTDIAASGKGLPPLLRALEVQKAAAKTGFDWPDAEPVFEKIVEETAEIREELAVEEVSQERLEKEVGDLLFSVVNLARKVGSDPSQALHRSNDSFIRRFTYIDTTVTARGARMEETPLEELDRIWEESKHPKR